MFSDQYKKDSEKIELDDQFLEQLKVRMRQERARLQEETADTEPTSKDDILINIKEKHTNHNWKHTLPIAFAACAALALVVTVPQQLLKHQSKGTSESAANSEANYELSSDTAATDDASMKFDMAAQDSTTSTESAGSAETNDAESTETSDAGTGSSTAANGTEEKESEAADTQAVVQEQQSSDSSFDSNNKVTTSIVGSEDASVYYGFSNLTFDEAELDLTIINEFQPTDSEVLTNLIDAYKNMEKGADQVSLDYAYNGRLILHDYYGMVIYDYQEENLIRIVDLKSRIGEYTTQGDTTLYVTVFEGGNYLLLDNNTTNTEDSLYYLYDVQTDSMVSMTQKQLDTLTLPSKDTHLTDATASFDSLFQPGNRSISASQISDTEQGILFYQSAESNSIASLSVCIAEFDEKGTLLSTNYLPIFGNDAISQLEESGYTLDGLPN